MMYALKICLYTDGDFGYNDTEFHIEPDAERVFYFKNREMAVWAFLRHFHCVNKSLKTYGRGYIDKWFNRWDKRIDMISQKIRTFKIEKCFGNQEVLYCIYEVTEKTLSNGALYYDEILPDIDFSIYNEKDIDWCDLSKLEDLKSED